MIVFLGKKCVTTEPVSFSCELFSNHYSTHLSCVVVNDEATSMAVVVLVSAHTIV